MNSNLTKNITKPLIIKIVGAFALLIILILSLTIFGVSIINQIKDNSNKVAKVNEEAHAAFSSSADVRNETMAYYDALKTGQNNGSFSQYSDAFYKDVEPLLETNSSSMLLLTYQTQLSSAIMEAFDNLSTGNVTAARAVQTQVDQISKQNIDLLNQILQQKFDLSNTVRQQTVNNSETTVGFLTLWAFITLILSCLIAWFIIAKVLTPLNRLNENLAQLLWGQTEHLTTRLNLLQYEVVNYNEMQTAARHDLKSPLSSIKGLAELSLILYPDLDNELTENINQIIQVSDSSVSMINNVLARREIHLNLQETDLVQMIDKILQLVDLRYYNVQRRVEVEYAVIDAGLMEHALLNLISNARKFSSGGIGVGVQLARKAGTASIEEVEFWVWNDGAVINGEQRIEIFKPGVQTEEGQKAGGHGLGLAIVKNIAELHHGRVNVDSHIKVGTTFRIILPSLTVTPSTKSNKQNLMSPQIEVEKVPELLNSNELVQN